MNFNFVKTANVLVGAIVASSFLGLPALADAPSVQQNGVPDAAAPGRDFPNQSDPRTGKPSANLNTGVSTPPTTSGPANKFNDGNTPAQDRPSENQPADRPMTNPTLDTPGTSVTESRPAPAAIPDSAAPGVREFPNQSDPRSGQPELRTPSQPNQ